MNDHQRDSQRGGVFRAVRVLEDRLVNPPSVHELADEAGLSLAEFLEAFRTTVGESVAQHIVRLRVEWAASLLKSSDRDVKEVGRICGFSDSSSFFLTFREWLGLSPQQFRERERQAQVSSTSGSKQATSKVGSVMVHDWPEVQLICLRAYLSLTEINRPWLELMTWARGQKMDLDQAQFYGLWFDDWEGTTTSSYRYESAILLPPSFPKATPPAQFFIRTLEAGRVAVSEARGNLYSLDRAWHEFATGWLPNSGFQLRGAFALDRYSNRLIQSRALKKIVLTALGGISLAMCLPVKGAEDNERTKSLVQG